MNIYNLLFVCRNAERVTPEEDIRELQQQLECEKEKLQLVRLQLAKKNRAIVSIQRQIDNIPDRTELAQYQRRFLELYNQGKNSEECHFTHIKQYIRKKSSFSQCKTS